jgi:hypothetical protein
MKSQWIAYHNKRILYIDLSDFKDDMKSLDKELVEAVATVGQEMYQQPLGSVLVLVDLRNTMLTQTANRLLSERIQDTKKFVRRTAVVGMTGIRKMFLDFFARLAESETGSFDEPEAAQDWLIR